MSLSAASQFVCGGSGEVFQPVPSYSHLNDVRWMRKLIHPTFCEWSRDRRVDKLAHPPTKPIATLKNF